MRPKPGEYWKRTYWGLTIYGKWMTMEEIMEEELALGASAEEWEYTRKTMEAQLAEGFFWGKAYSVACVDGEYGLTPLRTAQAITEQEFENARSAEWRD